MKSNKETLGLIFGLPFFFVVEFYFSSKFGENECRHKKCKIILDYFFWMGDCPEILFLIFINSFIHLDPRKCGKLQ
jgi:hypothetical protein